MNTRKSMKRAAKQVLKRHYWFLVLVCLIASFLGTEFGNSLRLLEIYDISEEESTAGTGVTTGRVHVESEEAIRQALKGNTAEGEAISSEIRQQAIDSTKAKGNEVFGHSQGIFAQIANSIQSGQVFIILISAIRSLGVSGSTILHAFVVLAMLAWLFFWAFFANVYGVISRRIFLECRTYPHVLPHRFLFLFRVKRWLRTVFTMLMAELFQFLWYFTIIGGVIKHYSYALVPYIVAENPDLNWREVIGLSRRMMKGHKWQFFLADLSFLGWWILDAVTMGLLSIFFLNPYRMAFFCEMYAEVRREAKENGIFGSERLCDTYLYEIPSRSVLEEAYGNLVTLMDEPLPEYTRLRGIRGFMAQNFGITIFNRKDEDAFREAYRKRHARRQAEAVLDAQIYPIRLFILPEAGKRERQDYLQCMRRYSIPTLILMFFIFSFLGWCWEVGIHLIEDGVFVNRGVLHGPWLPIYGSGSILILTLLYRFRRNPGLMFVATVVLCGVIEYFTSVYLEYMHNGMKWWDYSGYFLNLDGRICGEGLLIFGLGGLAITYLTAPLLDNYLRKIPYRISVPVCLILIGAFLADQSYSKRYPNEGAGITDYKGAYVEEIEHANL